LRLGIHILYRGGARFSGLEDPKFFLLSPSSLRGSTSAEVPEITRISLIVLVEVGSGFLNPWPALPVILWLISSCLHDYITLFKMPFEFGRKPDIPWNDVQCEPDMHTVDFLRRLFFSCLFFSMLFFGLLTGFLTGFWWFFKWVIPKKPQKCPIRSIRFSSKMH
jgi:hypothetical protein